MRNQTSRTTRYAGIAAVVASIMFVFVSPSVGAIVLAAGDTILVPVGSYLEASGPAGLPLDSQSVPFVGGDFTGHLVSSVFSGGGGLIFTYQLFNDITSTAAISRLTVNGFAGSLTDVAQAPVGGIGATVVDRADPNVVGWSFFSSPVGSGVVSPNASSELFIVYTDAPNWSVVNAAVINDSIATVSSLAPVPVPEPASIIAWTLMAAVGLGYGFRRRFVS